MQFHNLIVVADEFTTSDRPFALARRLSAAGNLSVQVVYGELDDGTRNGTPGWRLQRRLDAHGLSAATLSVVRSHEPELAVSEHLAGHEGSLVLRGTSAGGHDGGPLLDRVAETIMGQLAHPLLLLGPRQVNPRRDDQLSPITVRDGVSELTSLLAATESWTETFTNIHAELVDVLPPNPWPRTDVDNLERREAGPGTDITELRTLDLSAAIVEHLDGRHNAVVVVSESAMALDAVALVGHDAATRATPAVPGARRASPRPARRDGPATLGGHHATIRPNGRRRGRGSGVSATLPPTCAAGAAATLLESDDWSSHDWEHRLSEGPSVARFGAAELDGLPEPVRRYFRAAIALGTPMATTARLDMRGHINVARWLPFRAHQVLNPHVGFIWSARAAGIISGYDRYLGGVGEMHWKLLGHFVVAQGTGPDVSTSAAGRGGAEAIWIPTALLPRYGVTWTADDEHHITAHHHLGTTPIAICLTIDDAAAVRAISFQRWGDPDTSGTWGWHSFGGEITGHRTFAGLTIPSHGRLGWHTAPDGRASDEFFRFEVTSLALSATAAGHP